MNRFDEEIEQKSAGEQAELSAEKSAADAENSVTDAEKSVTDDEKKSDGEAMRPYANALSWVSNVIIAVSAVLILNLFFFRIISVSGTSMCDTLLDKDRVAISSIFYEPSYGDIVVIQADKLVNSGTDLYGEAIIKRVIGVAGDTIRINFEKGEVYRNGELLKEDYIKTLTTRRYSGWINSNEDYVVPENCVFVMGDNRNVSRDSRDIEAVGFVDKNLIMGKAFVRLVPISEFKWL